MHIKVHGLELPTPIADELIPTSVQHILLGNHDPPVHRVDQPLEPLAWHNSFVDRGGSRHDQRDDRRLLSVRFR